MKQSSDLRDAAVALLKEHGIDVLMIIDETTIPPDIDSNPRAHFRSTDLDAARVRRDPSAAGVAHFTLTRLDPAKAIRGELNGRPMLAVSLADVLEIANELDESV